MEQQSGVSILLVRPSRLTLVDRSPPLTVEACSL